MMKCSVKYISLCLLAVFVSSAAFAAGKTHLFAPLERLVDRNPGVMVNRDVVRGGGVIACRLLKNRGSITLHGLPSIVKARVVNFGQLEIARDQAVFTRKFHNLGVLKTTDTMVRFQGIYLEDGVYVSDPSDNYFDDDFIVGEDGYVVGGSGDNFYLRGDFLVSSTRNGEWSTGEAFLEFRDGFRDGALYSDHVFTITGTDFGPSANGYVDNFVWGGLNLAAGNTLQLLDGNSSPGGALYVSGISGLVIDGDTVSNISSPEGINIYYQPGQSVNDILNGLVYELSGHVGRLIPVWAKGPDIDHDGDVDGADLALLAADMNTSCPPLSACCSDINDDGDIDGSDLELFAPAFGDGGQ